MTCQMMKRNDATLICSDDDNGCRNDTTIQPINNSMSIIVPPINDNMRETEIVEYDVS